MIELRTMRRDEWDTVADLIYRSTNHWYESHGMGKIFQGTPDDCLVFCEVYEDLDPNSCWVAFDQSSERIVGSCFFHSRATHCSLGIMNSDPDAAGKGVAKQLLNKMTELAESQNKPLRLFSSALNLDSFSLYNRRGFRPYAVYQDMLVKVPESGMGVTIDSRVREATINDLPAIDALERTVWESSRVGDWKYFIENTRGVWHVSVFDDDGAVRGVLASIAHPGSNMIGPGVMENASAIAEALLLAELNANRGRTPVFLLPSANSELLARMYTHGARNCEIHVGQVLGDPPDINGIVLPSFMPETG